jgi:hypothetical protein
MMQPGFAEHFAREWVAAWNSHDLERVLSGLRFELLAALAGTDSVTVYYGGHRGLAAEVLHFGPGGKVRAAFAHYAEWSA